MANEFDPRLLRIGIEINGEMVYFENLYITAQGTRFGSDLNNQCQIRIDNIKKSERDFILRATSPYTRDLSAPFPKITVEAGRKSYGYTFVYGGMVTNSFITQPPEIALILNCETLYDKATEIVSYSTGAKASMQSIAKKAADELGLTLNFQATDKQITNFNVNGRKLDFVNKISELGNVDITVDNDTLIVKDRDVCLVAPVKTVSQKTGMIGIPERTEAGVLVKYLFDNNTFIYQNFRIESELNPTVNGDYELIKLGFDLSSRNTPFYWIAEGTLLYK